MATGDLKNNLRKLQFELRTIKYDRDVDFESLGRGVPMAFLPIYHYAFVEYSHPLAEKILEMHIEMYSKTDLRFIETMYKVLRELFNYKPMITKEQFFNPGFGEHKVMMCCNILHQVQAMHRTLAGVKMPARNPRSNQSVQATASRKSMSQMTQSQTGSTESPRLAEFNQSVKNLKPMKCLSLHTDSNQRSSPLVPVVISETLPAVTREPAAGSFDAGRGSKPIAETESRPDVRLRLDNGLALDVPGKIDHDRMILNETRINSHQAIINNISEQLSEVVSRVASMEERLNACVSHTSSCNKSVDNPAAADSKPQWLERSLENIVARLTLLETRLSFLEKQSKPLFPALESSTRDDAVTNVANKTQFDRTTRSSSPATIPLQRTNRDPVSSLVLVKPSVEPVNNTTQLQSERIEAMLRETDELLMKNFGVVSSALSEEKSDSTKETSNVSNALKKYVGYAESPIGYDSPRQSVENGT